MRSLRAGQILLPYLLLLVLLAGLATYVTINLIVDSLEEQFRDELAAGGLSANKAMVRLEDQHLTILRQMLFTEGVDRALAAQDVDSLERLLAPIAANVRTAYVDVFAADGTQLLALRSPDLGPGAGSQWDPEAKEWPPVAAVLRGATDAEGDKWAAVVQAPWGSLFLTAAPAKRDNRLVGAISVALPLSELAARLSEEAGTKGITLYRPDGSLYVSTIRATPAAVARALNLPGDEAAVVLARDRVLVRRVAVDGTPYVEAVGVLAIRRQLALLMGVSSPAEIIEQRGAQARNWMIALFSAAILAALAMGLRITRGLRRAGQLPLGTSDGAVHA